MLKLYCRNTPAAGLRRHLLVPAAALGAFVLTAAAGEGVTWHTNVKKALKKASAEKKDVLWDFTGSDWCGWCIRLRKEVFSQPQFKEEAPKDFVLLELDFPRRKKLPKELKEQNDKWLRTFGVRGFPTIFLTDAKGRPYAQTGYRPGGAKQYVAHLKELKKLRQKRDEALKKAKKAKGIDRAKLLDEVLSIFQPTLVASAYRDLAEEIIRLDEKNSAGLRNKYRALLVLADIDTLKGNGKLDEAVKKADEALKKFAPVGQFAQDLHFAKSEALYFQGKKDHAKEGLVAALNAAPKGEKAPIIKQLLKRLFGVEK